MTEDNTTAFEKEPSQKRPSVPLPVGAIAIFGFAVSFFFSFLGFTLAVMGLLTLFGIFPTNDFTTLASNFGVPELNFITPLIASFSLAIGVVMVLIGALAAAISIGLLKAKNWARITTVLILSLWISNYLTSIIMHSYSGNFFFFFLQVAIALYLVLDSNVKEAFEGEN